MLVAYHVCEAHYHVCEADVKLMSAVDAECFVVWVFSDLVISFYHQLIFSWHGRRLSRKTKFEKRLAITVFSFPPDKGNVGTAAYLNVFGSIHRVLTVRAPPRKAHPQSVVTVHPDCDLGQALHQIAGYSGLCPEEWACPL